MNRSHPLDVFVTNNTDRQILNIFEDHLAAVSPRKRKAATEHAVELLRQTEAPKFPHALAQALRIIEKSETLN